MKIAINLLIICNFYKRIITQKTIKANWYDSFNLKQ